MYGSPRHHGAKLFCPPQKNLEHPNAQCWRNTVTQTIPYVFLFQTKFAIFWSSISTPSDRRPFAPPTSSSSCPRWRSPTSSGSSRGRSQPLSSKTDSRGFPSTWTTCRNTCAGIRSRQLTQFFPVSFFVKKSLICLEGKSMTPQRGNTFLFCSSQQLPCLRLRPLKSFFS